MKIRLEEALKQKKSLEDNLTQKNLEVKIAKDRLKPLRELNDTLKLARTETF